MDPRDVMDHIAESLEMGDFKLSKVSASDISTLEEKIGKKLPKSYVDLTTRFGVGETPFARTLMPADMQGFHAYHDFAAKQWLPFGADYSGSIYCFDLMQKTAGDEYKILLLDGNEEYDSFDSFPEFIFKAMVDVGAWPQNLGTIGNIMSGAAPSKAAATAQALSKPEDILYQMPLRDGEILNLSEVFLLLSEMLGDTFDARDHGDQKKESVSTEKFMAELTKMIDLLKLHGLVA